MQNCRHLPAIVCTAAMLEALRVQSACVYVCINVGRIGVKNVLADSTNANILLCPLLYREEVEMLKEKG